MEIDPSTLTRQEAYKLTTGVIVPRPIAWVTSKFASGKINLAPFSAFNFVSHEPPMIMFCVARENGEMKDTALNVLREKEFVVNIANQDLLQVLHDSSARYLDDESEAEILGLETIPSSVISTPRLAAAPAALECVLEFTQEFGDAGMRMFVGAVKRYHIRDDLIHDGKVDTMALNPIARLGGPNYATLGEIITVASAKRKAP